ncbi:MAG: hypothetical protein IPM50_12285 [Acidobacteriota bacterium]|nr:MAG: hypothetical protein IPM50_12285 [Acidobacteriota bacterium]
MPLGYLLTILIETPILFLGLAKRLSVKQRLLCGVWLTACTYPIVVLVLPAIFQGAERWIYLAVAETFAPAAECLLFWLAFRTKGILETSDLARCFIAVIVANLASFGLGELIHISGVLSF